MKPCSGAELLLLFNPWVMKPFSGEDLKLLLTRGNETLLWS